METNPRSTDSTNRVPSYDDGSASRGFPVNPFVGLRPFRSDEGLLFFGRREQTLELLHQLQLSRFLSVVGSSGCGKSSLIRAGLIPKLEAGFLVEQRDRWRIATAKPGDAPLLNLAQSLVKSFSDQSDSADVAGLVDGMRTVCAQAVVEFLTTRLKDSDANLLLLIDQFEELFTFGRYGQGEVVDAEDMRSKEAQMADRVERERRRDEAADFVSIMLGLAEQRELPIYVVMTMRSDFLGDCDVFYRLPEAINECQYLVPRLPRPQRAEAIENPIFLYGQTISQRLLDRVLNDAGEEADQLPVMQHAMMRTWEKWKTSGDPIVDLEHYEAAGTMKQALSNDAEEALSGMSPQDVSITKKLFQALTDNDPRGRRIRRPTHLRDLQAITGASREKLLDIISNFSGHGRSFLHVSQEDTDPLVDISHESLIRQWSTLHDWVTKESRSREIYLRLVGTAIRYYKPKPEDELIRGAALQVALDWKEKRKPNQAWANRYHPSLDVALKFLDESKAQRDRDLAEAERLRNEAVERERRELEAAQRLAEAEAAARKKELDQALELATQREAAARWQRRAIYGLGLLLILAIGTTVFAVRAGIKAEQRKNQAKAAEEVAKAAEKVAEDLSMQLAANVNQLEASLKNETNLKDRLEKNLASETKLREKAQEAQAEAQRQAARANREASKARDSARSEKEAKDEAEVAAELAYVSAEQAKQAHEKAIATQLANQTFRAGLTAARSNNRTAAATKYTEAVELYASLPEPDSEGVATTYLELADMYLKSEDTAELDKGIYYIEKAEKAFEDIGASDGMAAVLIKMGDFVGTDRVIREFVMSEGTDVTLESALIYKEAHDLYLKTKNLDGLTFTIGKVANVLRTTDEAKALNTLITMYEDLLPYYADRDVAHERRSLFLEIGELYKRMRNTEQAKKNFDNALNVYRAYPDKDAKEAEAKTHVDIAFVLGDTQDIQNGTEQALRTVRATQDIVAEANTLRYIGNKFHDRWRKGPTSRPGFSSEPEQAKSYYVQALVLYRSLPETKIKQAETLTDLGTINLAIDKSLALNNFQNAYRLYEENESAKRAVLLFNIGSIFEEKGELQAALKSYKDALEFYGDNIQLDGLRTQRAAKRVQEALAKSAERP